ncbi:MAG: hypothetical protein AB7T14_10165, partial [Candidatus Methylacidiphilaceae bacterium]
ASVSPIVWHLLTATSYLGLTAIFASVFAERGLFGELRETGTEMLRGLISKKSLLFAFWSLMPEMPRMIFCGLYEMMASLVAFCSVAFAVCSTLFLGAVLPALGSWWAMRRQRRLAESLIAGWTDLHREIALAAAAIGASIATYASRLEGELLTPAAATNSLTTKSPALSSSSHPLPKRHGKGGSTDGEPRSLS